MLVKSCAFCHENGAVVGLSVLDLPHDLATLTVCQSCARDAQVTAKIEIFASAMLGTSTRAASMQLCLNLCTNCATDLTASLRMTK